MTLLIAAAFQGARGQASNGYASSVSPETGTINGRLMMEGKPLAGIRIVLVSTDEARPSSSNALTIEAMTAPDGKFRLTGVPPGTFTLTAIAGAYVLPREGYRGMAGRSVAIRAGEQIDGIDLLLRPGAVITGQVTDYDGSAIAGLRITLQSIDPTGKKRETVTNLPNDTDDRGVFRLYGLPVGQYLISVQGRDLRLNDNARFSPAVYAPGVVEVTKARVVEVSKAGEEINNVNIVLNSHPEVFSARGRVVDSSTRAGLANIHYRFAEATTQPPPLTSSPISETDTNGEFVIDDLSRGHYVVYATPDAGAGIYSDVASFDVNDADVTGLEVRVHRGATLTGVLSIEGTNAAASAGILDGVSVLAGQADDVGITQIVMGN